MPTICHDMAGTKRDRQEAEERMKRRHVSLETPDGVFEECYGHTGELCRVTLTPGHRYVILPAHHNRKRNRGRECIFVKPRRVRAADGGDRDAARRENLCRTRMIPLAEPPQSPWCRRRFRALWVSRRAWFRKMAAPLPPLLGREPGPNGSPLPQRARERRSGNLLGVIAGVRSRSRPATIAVRP